MWREIDEDVRKKKKKKDCFLRNILPCAKNQYFSIHLSLEPNVINNFYFIKNSDLRRRIKIHWKSFSNMCPCLFFYTCADHFLQSLIITFCDVISTISKNWNWIKLILKIVRAVCFSFIRKWRYDRFEAKVRERIFGLENARLKRKKGSRSRLDAFNWMEKLFRRNLISAWMENILSSDVSRFWLGFN